LLARDLRRQRQRHERIDLQRRWIVYRFNDYGVRRRHVLQRRRVRIAGGERRNLPERRSMPERKLHRQCVLRRRSGRVRRRLQEPGVGLGQLRYLRQAVPRDELRERRPHGGQHL
jgi:hypothetical protein